MLTEFRLSCTAFFSQFFRMYSPVAFGKKWDPEGHLIRKYVPELKNFSKKYIYEPHLAPIADQKEWGCQIKGDGTEKGTKGMAIYPKPMLDFNEARQKCLDKMKEAYDAGLYGNDEKVMSGEWKKIFDYSEGKQNKDETNDKAPKSQKRAHTPVEHEEDDGTHADVGHDSEEEPPRKSRRAQPKSAKKTQGNLDGMVTREKRKS